MKLICVGRNYTEHIKELNNAIPENPVLFIKPDSAIIKKGMDFYLPEFSSEIHHEIELILKINKVGKHIAPEFAGNYFEEIALGIDFTARDLQNKLKEKGLPWEISKGFDGSAMIGEFVSKTDFDLGNVNFELLNNGEKVQVGNSSEMITKIPELISYISSYFTLKKGDLIFTGTPSGVAKVNEGDYLEGFLEGVKNFDLRIR